GRQLGQVGGAVAGDDQGGAGQVERDDAIGPRIGRPQVVQAGPRAVAAAGGDHGLLVGGGDEGLHQADADVDGAPAAVSRRRRGDPVDAGAQGGGALVRDGDGGVDVERGDRGDG